MQSSLLESRAAVNKADDDGMTPLHSASAHGHEDVVMTLMDYNANVNQLNRRLNVTPLYCAIGKGHIKVAKLLLQRGCKFELCVEVDTLLDKWGEHHKMGNWNFGF